MAAMVVTMTLTESINDWNQDLYHLQFSLHRTKWPFLIQGSNKGEDRLRAEQRNRLCPKGTELEKQCKMTTKLTIYRTNQCI